MCQVDTGSISISQIYVVSFIVIDLIHMWDRCGTVSVWYRIDMDRYPIYINAYRVDMGSINALYKLALVDIQSMLDQHRCVSGRYRIDTNKSDIWI